MGAFPKLPSEPAPTRPRSEGRTRRAFLYALGMHALLLALLVVGVQWQSSPPAGAEAELWDDVPEVAQQPAVKAPVVAVTPPAPEPDADIALAAKKKQRQVEAAALAAQQAAQQAQALKDQALKDKALKDKALKEQALKDKALKDKALKDKAAKEQAHADQVARLRGAAGVGGSGGSQGASSGGGGDASPGYADRIRRKVEQNTDYRGPTGDGSQTAVVLVRLAPSGEVLSKRLVKPSGIAEWDQAVLRAVDRASPLPRDVDGTIPRKVLQDGIRITFRLRG